MSESNNKSRCALKNVLTLSALVLSFIVVAFGLFMNFLAILEYHNGVLSTQDGSFDFFPGTMTLVFGIVLLLFTRMIVAAEK